ncbi:MAG TPA: Zn-ribbon domain-containing OB-fold protein [Candidatus Acidoferrales bacterium]|nr:Zn-ribbon domain-containing OB-fold protein [Candidatus Acidoferrales bacterium]
MSQQAAAASEGKKTRPIVPFLRLGADGEKPYLVGKKCSGCGAVYLGSRVACSKCSGTGPFNEIRLSDKGSLWVYSIVHQSVPGVPTPYVAAIVDLPEGVSVRCNIIDIEPKPEKIEFGMPVEMVTKKVREDKDGNDVIAFFFRPAR